MTLKTTLKLTSALVLCLSLAACKTSEERAEERFQSGLALLEAGDTDRAIVEFRNVFTLDGFHRDARWNLANALLEKENRQDAYSELLRLAEQYPEDLDVRLLLSRMAFEFRNFSEVERHGEAANNIAPDDPLVQIVQIGRSYRAGVVDENEAQLVQAARSAEERLSEFPDNRILRTVLIDRFLRQEDYDNALFHMEQLLRLDPRNKTLQEQKLAILASTGDQDSVEAHLRQMVSVFDGDVEVKGTLLRFLMANGEADKAEEFLRSVSSPSDPNTTAHLDLIRFLTQVKSREAAMVEVEKGIAQNPNPAPFRAIRASFLFDQGDRAGAIAEMEDTIASMEPSSEQNSIKIALARMLVSERNEVGARNLIEEVLADDAINSEALKMRAAWLINSDQPEEAISDLRRALDSSSEDSEVMTMIAQAYERMGDRDLRREYLALASEASDNAPEETQRYVNLLMQEEQYLPAEDALIASLRLNPGNVDLLQMLGQVYLALSDEARLRQVMESLRRANTQEASDIANQLEARLLNEVSGSEEALAFLEQVARSEDSSTGPQLFLLRGRLSTGDIDGAQSLLNSMLSENPDNIALKTVQASIFAVAGDYAQAETTLRAVLDEDPTVSRNWIELSRLLTFQGRNDEADAIIDEGLAANPSAPGMRWAKASILERDGDIDGAITIYNGLYDENPGNQVIANNLASLLATYRSDEETLERAYAIARRLRGTEVPQFQDTYGWIMYRRGDYDEAMPYLRSASRALENDPLAQYHYGMVLSKTGDTEGALTSLQRAIDLEQATGTMRPQIITAQEEIERLKSQ